MVAPCGLDCNICSQALLEKDPCQGCNGPADHKPEFALCIAGLFSAASGGKTDTSTVMNVRTIPVRMLWRRRPAIPQSTRIESLLWRICG